jgi:hypothetical protein
MPPPGSGRTLNVVAPAAPAPIKIKPGQSADEVEVEVRPGAKAGSDFGRPSGSWIIKPSAPLTEE